MRMGENTIILLILSAQATAKVSCCLEDVVRSVVICGDTSRILSEGLKSGVSETEERQGALQSPRQHRRPGAAGAPPPRRLPDLLDHPTFQPSWQPRLGSLLIIASGEFPNSTSQLLLGQDLILLSRSRNIKPLSKISHTQARVEKTKKNHARSGQ